MTIEEIHKEVSAVKPVSRRQVLRYMKAAFIQPIGCRQRPQPYPDDTAERIKKLLGLNGNGHRKPAARNGGNGREGVVTMPALRKARAAARKARAK